MTEPSPPRKLSTTIATRGIAGSLWTPYHAAVRVLVVAAWPPWPLNDGDRLILHHQLRVLGPRHDIVVVAGNRRPGEEPPAGLIPTAVDFRWFGPRRAGPLEYARRRVRSLATGEPADLFRIMVPEFLTAVDEQLRTQPDVVYLMGSGTALLAATVRKAGLPVVHMPIDAWREAFGKHVLLPWWRRGIEGGQLRKVRRHEVRHLGACDAVVVVAERDAASLRDAVPGIRVRVVPNGVEAGPAPDLDAPRSPILGIHGTLTTLPNRTAAIALANDVLPRVQATMPEARARIIGRDPAPDVLAVHRSDVEVTGEVADVAAELAKVAVYVVPMTEGSGIKNKVLEAMAAGLPVVCTPRAIDGIGAGPGIVVAEDADGLAAAALTLLEDPDRRRSTGAAGRRRVCEDFTWERSAGAIEDAWRDVVATRVGEGTNG
jgi:glycosyltransferase involved in cell wall biosynthesis